MLRLMRIIIIIKSDWW